MKKDKVNKKIKFLENKYIDTYIKKYNSLSFKELYDTYDK